MKDLSPAIAASAVLLLLVWAPGEPFPTQDGPAHLYNASLLRDLPAAPAAAASARLYELRPEYTASLPGHLVLGALLGVAGAARAENVLITLYGVALVWVIALGPCPRGGRRWAAYLALPLALNLCLDMGFYNFCLALPCLLAVVILWARESPLAGGALAALLALATALLHPAAGMILVGTIAAVEAADVALTPGRGVRAGLRFVLPLVPAVVFLAWHLSGGEPAEIVWHDPRARVAELLVPLALFHGSDLSLAVAAGVGAVLWWQLGARLRSWRALDRCTARLLGAAALVFVATLAAPDEAAGGGYIGLRLNTIFFLLVLCAVGSAAEPARSTRGVRAAGLALSAATVVAIALQVAAGHGRFDALVRLEAAIPAGSTVLGIAAGEWFDDGRASLVPPLARPNLHAASYAGVGRDVAVLGNYEARRAYFPVRYRAGSSPYGTVLRGDDDEWRFAELTPLTPAGACAADFLLWEKWSHPATRRAFAAETLALVGEAYEVAAEEGSYTLLRCRR